MKKIILSFACIIAIGLMHVRVSQSQIMLQKAVVSNGGAIATNGSTAGAFIVGQTAVGTASNAQTTGHFGFFATPNAANAVAAQGAGAISSMQLMPNPASDQVSINISLATAANIDLLLYDASGHFVTTIFSGRKEGGSFTQHFDV